MKPMCFAMSQQTVAKADLVSSHQDEDIAKITQRLFRSHTSFMESSTPSDQYWHPASAETPQIQFRKYCPDFTTLDGRLIKSEWYCNCQS